MPTQAGNDASPTRWDKRLKGYRTHDELLRKTDRMGRSKNRWGLGWHLSFFCSGRLGQEPQTCEKHEQHDRTHRPGYLRACLEVAYLKTQDTGERLKRQVQLMV